MKKTNKILLLVAIIIVAVLLIFSWQATLKNKAEQSARQNVPAATAPAHTILVYLEIKGVASSTSYVVDKNSTALLVLQVANQHDKNLNLETQDYKDLGTLVTQLGNKINGQDKKYWQYEVNGVQPMVGADKYILKNNDQIVWSFAPSQF